MSHEPTDPIPGELGSNARTALEDFIDRIERLEQEKAATVDDIKAVYAEAGGSGLDKKALRQIVKERSKADMDKTIKQRRMVELYRRALAKSKQPTFGDWARGWLSREAKDKIDDAKSDAADPKLAEFLKGRRQQKSAGDAAGDANG